MGFNFVFMDLEIDENGCKIAINRIDSPNVLVFVPGIPGHANSRDILAANQAILDAGIASTFRYTSIRDFEAWDLAKANRNIGEMWLAYTKEDLVTCRCVPKTYQDELNDFMTVIGRVPDKSPEQIFLSGFSYGGGLATLLLDGGFAERVTKLFLASPQIYALGRESMPCFGGFPKKEKFLEAIAGYDGELLVVHHKDDPVVRTDDVAELFSRAGTDKKDFKLLEGTCHGFAYDPKAYAEMHVEFFQE